MINNSLNRPGKIKIIIFISVIAISFLIIGLMVSCGGSSKVASGSNNTQTGNQDSGTASSDEIVQEETVDSVKGEDLTNYDTVKVGAELKGAIPSYLCTNKDNILTIEIKNTSDFTWRNDSKNSVRVGYHYYGQDVDASDYDGTMRTELKNNVAPGETIKVDMLMNDIKQPGNYVIQIDLVLEGKYWFSSKGVEMIESPTYFGESAN
ncbi:MAG: hypothetical protein NTZ89_03005 [Actinobacteria bacterium]|nr:hypothetical protein [Actinomycetota bacterium]